MGISQWTIGGGWVGLRMVKVNSTLGHFFCILKFLGIKCFSVALYRKAIKRGHGRGRARLRLFMLD